MATSDPGYDAGAYVDEMAALNERLRRDFENLEKVYADRDKVILRWQGALGELNELHDVLAAGLGYPRYRDTEEPPGGYPDSPDAYVTGDHTPVTLAMKAVRALAEAEASRQAWAAEADRWTANALFEADAHRRLLHDYDALTSALCKRWGAKKTQSFIAQVEQENPYRPGPVLVIEDDGSVHLERPTTVCACISDDQATQLGPGFSRPECAVHPKEAQ